MRFGDLHDPLARSLRVVDDDGRTHAAIFDVEGCIADVAPRFAVMDFHEIETAQRIERFGQVAHVRSRHEARATPQSPALLKRGANSIQLCREHGRWWVISTVWDSEREGVTPAPWQELCNNTGQAQAFPGWGVARPSNRQPGSTASSSTSNTSDPFGGITPPAPLRP